MLQHHRDLRSSSRLLSGAASAALTALLLAGCSGGAPGLHSLGGDGDALSDAIADGSASFETSDPDAALDAAGIATPADSSVDPAKLGWDASPPVGPAQVVLVINTPLLDGPTRASWVHDWEGWEAVDGASPLVERRLYDCDYEPATRPPSFDWEPSPALVVDTLGWRVVLRPDSEPDHWIGEAYPPSGADPDCREALADVGLQLPLPVTAEMRQQTLPQDDLTPPALYPFE